MPDFSLERKIGGVIAGIDEAGRGPWAGPVIAAAVILDANTLPPLLRDGLDDSKKLSAARRDELFAALFGVARLGIGRAEVDEIDRVNILQATLNAMARALAALGIVPDAALVDGNRAPSLPCRAVPVIRGDGRSLSIAAASIAAKVTRDREMAALARSHPGYGWERNKGYGTAAHAEALKTLGVSEHHRKSFKPIFNMLRERVGEIPYIESPDSR